MADRIKRFVRDGYVLVKNKTTGEQWREYDTGPSTLRKAANFTRAIVKHARTGRVKASLEVINQRFAICANCPSGKFAEIGRESLPGKLAEVETVGTCLHKTCGCFIHDTPIFPNKLAFESQSCPLGNWQAVEGSNATKGCCDK